MKRIAHNQSAPLGKAYAREINAKFQSRLPKIIEEISESLMVIEPVVNDVAVPLHEFIDFLNFEIDKTKLDIARDSWEAVVDVNKMNEARSWLAQLEQLRADFNVETMRSSVNFIRAMVARVTETFQLRKNGPSGGGP
jgi:hypothetical protein